MKKLKVAFAAVGLIVLVILGYVGVRLIEKYTPTKEQADPAVLYGTEPGRPAVFYNYELLDVRGIYENGQTYLPLSWVNQAVNERFYWDATEELLVYALPDQIVYADAETKGSSGAPLLLNRDGEVYLALGLISSYTDAQIYDYEATEVGRVFVNDWGSRDTARVTKTAKVREKGGIKSPIVTEVSHDTEVLVLERLDDWSRIATPDGNVGYIRNKALADTGSRTFSRESDNYVPSAAYGEAFGFSMYAGAHVEQVYQKTSLDEKIVLGWHQVTNQEANGQLESILAQTKGLNVIAPTWFALSDNEGNYRSLASQAYVEKAHEKGLQVWALLDNFSDNVQTEVLLSSTTTRRKLINSLMAEVERYDLDGLNMDFEGIKEEAGVHYIQFLRELSIPCREKGIVLSVDNYVPTAANEFYNRAEQANVADYLIVMGYDEHWAGGTPGSVASIDFVKNGIADTLKQAPKEQVINAVPFYTRIWTEKDGEVTSKAYGIARAKQWIEENHVELHWQEPLGQYYGEMELPDSLSYLWMEEEDSLRLKMEAVREADLAGVACWKLGLEDAAAWESISWD